MSIKSFIDRSIDRELKPFTLREFMIKVQTEFYPDQDIEFMDYFLELCDEKNEGKFVVPHQKLIEYGATVSARSGDVKDRLDALSLSENEDFLTVEISVVRKNGGATRKKVYMLTPAAFKLILIGATKHAKHKIDVSRYRKYYLFLEKIVKYYMDYQFAANQARLAKSRLNASLLQHGNGSLREEIQLMREEQRIAQEQAKKQFNVVNDQLTNANTQLSSIRSELTTANGQLSSLNVEMTGMREEQRAFFRMFAHVVFTPKIMDDLISEYNGGEIEISSAKPAAGMERVKVFYMFIWRNADWSSMTVQVACRNLAQVPKQLRLITERMNAEGGIYVQAVALGLCDKEVNQEVDIFTKVFNRQIELNEKCTFKRFALRMSGEKDFQKKRIAYVKALVEGFRAAPQKRVDVFMTENDNPDVRERGLYVKERYSEFSKESRIICQRYLNAFICRYRSGRITIRDGRQLKATETLDELTNGEGGPIMLSKATLAKVQLKMLVRDLSMEQFIQDISEATDEVDSEDDTDDE